LQITLLIFKKTANESINKISDICYFRLCFRLWMCESLGPFRLAARPFAVPYKYNGSTDFQQSIMYQYSQL